MRMRKAVGVVKREALRVELIRALDRDERVLWLCDSRPQYLERLDDVVGLASIRWKNMTQKVRRGSPAVFTLGETGRVTFVSTLNAMRGMSADLVILERDEISDEARLFANLVVSGVGGEVIEVARP